MPLLMKMIKLKLPILTLWGSDGAIEKHFDCLKLWRECAHIMLLVNLYPGGHYLAEECPNLCN